MSDYDLYYWPIPFRGQFVRAVLAFAGKSWREHEADEIPELKGGALAAMPVPFMGPPVLIDKKADFAVSQMPAILLYLGETLRLLPESPALRAMTLKVICDANDVIDDLTLDGGRLMWTKDRWEAFVPRFRRWMGLFEETGRRHGLKADSGFLLGGDGPGLADVVAATLWGTMTAHFPPIEAIFEATAPLNAGLTRRVGSLPALAALAAKTREDFGEVYCGGQIEKSLRKVLAA